VDGERPRLARSLRRWLASHNEVVMRIRTILCPIEFSNLSGREIQSAAEVGRAFGARLVLHHNRMAIAPGLARAWDWEATHRTERFDEAEAERRMAAALAAVPAGIPAEGVISASGRPGGAVAG